MTSPTTMSINTRAVIVGAGRVGLTMAYALLQRGLKPQVDFILMTDGSSPAITDAQAMELTRRQVALPRIPPPGDPKRPITIEDLAHYQHSYAEQLGLIPLWYTRIDSILIDPHGHGLRVVTNSDEIATRNIVITDDSVVVRARNDIGASDVRPDRANDQTSGMFSLSADLPSRAPVGSRRLRAETARVARAITRRP